MDTWDQIHCEEVYNEYSDIQFMLAELAAWEQEALEQVNFELQELGQTQAKENLQ